jgi:hypothetical protein
MSGMRALLVLAALSTPAFADDVLHPGTPELDPPTITALGVALPITGDDNFTATVAVRYRVSGTTAWHDALPLQHVHAEAVMGFTVEPSFAGSIFDLAPDTDYDIELHATDADGGVDQTLMLTAHTRPVPGDPAHPHAVPVTDAASLTSALAAAQPGDVITLAAGTYAGQFALHTSGTQADPIVIRGAGDATILDGGGCTGCNVLEVYGSDVHIENLAIAHATRALRFQTQTATRDVVRRVHISDVTLAIGSQADQTDFYIADNVLEGRLTWPCTYASDDTACNAGGQHGLHANDDGVHLEGTGHVVTHNRISGFGDAMKIEEPGARSVDFIGNDVLWTYDNAIELDTSLRNTRALRNRLTNTYATLSFQPIFGGPAYAIRNVIVNVADEQFKLHSLGGTPTVGAVILHNTVLRGVRALQCSTAFEPRYFTVKDNIFEGPATIADGHTVRWDVPSVATATIDENGYAPDGEFELGYGSGGTTYPSFEQMRLAGMFEHHGTLLGTESGIADWTVKVDPMTPAPPASAVDYAGLLPNVNDGFAGNAPDLGALETGCDPPIYGPRPEGIDETNEPIGCIPPGSLSDDVIGGDDPSGSGGSHSGGCCQGAPSSSNFALVLVVLAALRRRDKRRSTDTSRDVSIR